MKPVRIIAIAVLACHMMASPAQAQRANTSAPAEYPPSSFNGLQYVDSRGCVYIRAGLSGAVNWVPRMNRAREQICNAQPTYAKGQVPVDQSRPTRAAAPEILVPKGEPVQTAAAASVAAQPRPAAQTQARVPAAAPTRTQAAPRPAAAAKPAPVRVLRPASTAPAARPAAQTGNRPIGRQPMPTIAGSLPDPTVPMQRNRVAAADARTGATAAPPVYRATRTMAPAPAAAQVQQMARVSAVSVRNEGCRWASDISAQYMRGPGVRCGPQKDTMTRMSRVLPQGAIYAPQARATGAILPARLAEARQGSGPMIITSRTRIAPRHVWAMQQQVADLGPTPKGYRQVWEDDRLNPYRAHQTLEGKRMMDLRWTRDLPRRLIDVTTGADVTAFYPDMVYPQTMPQAGGSYMSTRGSASAAPAQGRLAEVQRELGMSSAPRRMSGVISTRSAPRSLPAGASSRAVLVGVTHRYVQVGVFGSDAQAQAAAARLKRAGLTLRVRPTQNGNVVLAGPYGTHQQLGNALYAVRQSGYPGAFTRK